MESTTAHLTPADDPAFDVLTAATTQITVAAIEAKIVTTPDDIFQFMINTYQTAAKF